MGNLGKATSFIDPEGDGDVMPKLVDMLTKVLKLKSGDQNLEFLKALKLYDARTVSRLCYQVGVEVPEFLGEGGSGGDAGGDDDEDWG